jgi:hypothetical protein
VNVALRLPRHSVNTDSKLQKPLPSITLVLRDSGKLCPKSVRLRVVGNEAKSVAYYHHQPAVPNSPLGGGPTGFRKGPIPTTRRPKRAPTEHLVPTALAAGSDAAPS